jgi:hypothetical protein
VSGPSVRIFLGGLPNVMILHLEFLICGMKNGLIKLWKPEDSDAHVSRHFDIFWLKKTNLETSSKDRLQGYIPFINFIELKS